MDRPFKLTINGPVDSILTEIVNESLSVIEIELIRIAVTTTTGIIADEATRQSLIESLDRLGKILKETRVNDQWNTN